MSRKIVSMQIKTSEDIRNRAKHVAKTKGTTLRELILSLLASTGDKELAKLIERELKESPRPGRPWDK
jgi:predicted DNA-binding protein